MSQTSLQGQLAFESLLQEVTTSRPYLQKQASSSGLKSGVQLFTHQKEAVQKILDKDGNLLLSHPVGSGKCVRASTLLLTNEGVSSIEELFPDIPRNCPEYTLPGGDLQVPGYSPTGIVWRKVRARYAQQVAETTYCVALRGDTLEATAVHPFLVATGGKLQWRSTQDLQVGDLVAVASELSVPAELERDLNEDVAVLLAWQVTEGWEHPHKGACSIAQADTSILNALQERLQRVAPTYTGGRIVTPTKRVPYLRFCSKEYRQQLEQLGYVWGCRSKDKKLPKWFPLLKKETLRKVLSAIFTAEGSVGNVSIELTTASKHLAAQLRLCLLRFGIHASLRSKLGRATNGKNIQRQYWRLSISGEDTSTFHQEFSFESAPKQQKLGVLAGKKHNPNVGIAVGDLLDLLTQQGITYDVLEMPRKGCIHTVSVSTATHLMGRIAYLASEAALLYYTEAARVRSGTARAHAMRTLSALRSAHTLIASLHQELGVRLRAPLRWEKVLSITPGETGGYVYDLTVDADNYDDQNYLVASGGVVIHNTLTAIAAFEALKQAGKAQRALVVAPASLRTNFVENGVKKFTNSRAAIFGNAQEATAGTHVTAEHPDKKADYHVVSYELFRANPEKYIKASGADTVIYDELHRAKNEGVLTSKAIKDARPLHRNFIGMTGSIVSNTPADIVPLVDAMTNGNHSLGSKTSFESRFVQQNENGTKALKNPQVLRAFLAPYVHHVDAQTLNTRAPEKKIETVLVNMSPHQTQLYRYLTDQLDPLTKIKMQMGASKLNSSELNNIFSKLVRLRQVSNSVHTVDLKVTPTQSARDTPKIRKLLDDVEDHIRETPDAQVVIHTNLIQGGVDVLTAGLKDRNIDHALFIGKGNAGVTEKARQHGVKEFQEGKKKVIVLSAAGGEGLDLPNTTFMAMLDGHFNPERINQAEARGVRAGGQAHRAEKDRQVLVRRYMSIVPNDAGRTTEVAYGIWDNISPTKIMERINAGGNAFYNPFQKHDAPDQWIYRVAKQKGELNKGVHDLLKHSSVVTHEEVDDLLCTQLEKVAGGALLRLAQSSSPATGALVGSVLGGIYGLAAGGLEPRTKQEAQQDPDAAVRTRMGSAIGGTLAGAAAGGSFGANPLIAISAPMLPILNTQLGTIAGRNFADLLAPKRGVPLSVQHVLGDNTRTYSDKAIFAKYWDRFGDELEKKGPHGEVANKEEELKFVHALRDLYQAAATEKRLTARQAAGPNKGEVISKADFWKKRAIPGMAVTGLVAGASTLAHYATAKALPNKPVTPAVVVALDSIPAAMAIGGALAKQYRDTFIDPGVTTSASKGDMKKRIKFTDEELQKLLRGHAVDEIKTKSHFIK